MQTRSEGWQADREPLWQVKSFIALSVIASKGKQSRLRRRREISAPHPSWPGLSRPSKSLNSNTLEDCHDLIDGDRKIVANLCRFISWTTWMAGTSPAMTTPI